jgi:site-specific recombinase XerC
VVSVNPAASVRGPAHSVWRGNTPVVAPEKGRQLLDSIDVTKSVGLRDRALIALLVLSFARIGSAPQMRFEDVFVQHRRHWVRLHQKGSKQHEMPCHHAFEEYLHAYIDGRELGSDPNGQLFRTIARGTGQSSKSPLPRPMRFGWYSGAPKPPGYHGDEQHTLHATGIMACLKNSGTLEKAPVMANTAQRKQPSSIFRDRRSDAR